MDLLETSHYDEASDSLIVKTSYDNTEVLKENEYLRNTCPETGRYKGNLVKIASLHLGDLVRLKNAGYNILSPDPDEWRRALLFVQSNEKGQMTVPGTPIGKRKQSWV